MQRSAPNSHPVAKLAALIPAFNPGEALHATLHSLSEQPVDCEVFVVDDGSTPAIRLPASLNGKPVHLLRLEQNIGITGALNAGLELILARGFEFISRHDCGDVDHAERLALQVAYLQQHPDVMLLGSSVRFIASGEHLRFVFDAPETQAAIRRKMRYSAAVVHSSCMFRAQVFETHGRYSDRYPHAEDYDLFFRILNSSEVRNLRTILVTARYDPGGISIRYRRISLRSRLAIQWRYFDPRSIHSYLGMAQTIGLNVVPYELVSRCKALLSRRVER